MDQLIQQLKQTLCRARPLNIVDVRVDESIHALRIIDLNLQVYLYDYPVKHRLEDKSYIPTIHVDCDQLSSKYDVVVARLLALMGFSKRLFARNCVVARVDKQVTTDFLKEHHMQSAIPGKYRYGLFHDGELVCLAVFSGGRKMNNQSLDYRSFELIRFCHKMGFLVVGGITKILKTFVEDFDPGDIMTYVDRDWSRDSSLLKIGFEIVSETAPQCFILSEQGRVSYCKGIDSPSGLLKYNSGSTKLLYRIKT